MRLQPVELNLISVARAPGNSHIDFGEQRTGSAACAGLQERAKAGPLRLWHPLQLF